jgi:hypothetical protein
MVRSTDGCALISGIERASWGWCPYSSMPGVGSRGRERHNSALHPTSARRHVPREGSSEYGRVLAPQRHIVEPLVLTCRERARHP